MRRLIGVIAALVISPAIAPVAQAHPCSPEPVCHEFDWAIPYYDAFDRHDIGYIANEMGIPLMNEVDKFCRGKASQEDVWSAGDRRLTDAEAEKVIEAAADVCPSGPLLRAQ